MKKLTAVLALACTSLALPAAAQFAKPEIWSDAAGFKQKEQAFQDGVAKLSAAADSGDLAKVRAAFGAVGASCKACHDAYRK